MKNVLLFLEIMFLNDIVQKVNLKFELRKAVFQNLI